MNCEISIENLDQLIKNNIAFIVKVVSSFTGRYVNCEHDDEFSIALIAFMDAVKKFDDSKGNFYSFARIVIENRLKNYYKEENKYSEMASIEFLNDKGIEFVQEEKEDTSDLKDEIVLYKQELQYFGLTFDDLVGKAPKHVDTRQTAFRVAGDISENKEIVSETYRKKHLPIKMVSDFTKVSEKIVKHSKEFILATMIVFLKNYSNIKAWIKETRCSHAS